MLNFQMIGATGLGGLILGASGAFYLSGAAKAKADKKRAQAALQAEQEAHIETKALIELKDGLVLQLRASSADDRAYISSLTEANLTLATRTPRDTVRYIERGQDLAEQIKLEGGNECLAYVVPNKLRQYANGGDIEASLPITPGF